MLRSSRTAARHHGPRSAGALARLRFPRACRRCSPPTNATSPSRADRWTPTPSASTPPRARQYLAWLAAALAGGTVQGDPLTDSGARDRAVRDYRTHLQTVAKRKPATINAHLTAVDDFYRRRGLGPAAAERAEIPSAALRALDE
jgi:hypothetical protein